LETVALLLPITEILAGVEVEIEELTGSAGMINAGSSGGKRLI